MATQGYIRIVDGRPDATEQSNFTRDYDEDQIRAVIDRAHAHGVDPYTALAISLQEGGFATGGMQRVQPVEGGFFDAMIEADEMGQGIKGEVGTTAGRSNKNYWDSPAYKESQGLVNTMVRGGNLADQDAFVQAMKQKFDYAKKLYGNNVQEDLMLQTYNGLGNIPAGSYGSNKPMSGLVDRPYGKRIQALRKYTIMPNTAIRSIIAERRNSQDQMDQMRQMRDQHIGE